MCFSQIIDLERYLVFCLTTWPSWAPRELLFPTSSIFQKSGRFSQEEGESVCGWAWGKDVACFCVEVMAKEQENSKHGVN